MDFANPCIYLFLLNHIIKMSHLIASQEKYVPENVIDHLPTV